MDQDIHDPHQRWDFLRGHQASKDEMFFQAQSFGLGFESRTPGSITDEQKFHFRALLNEGAGNSKEVVVAFQLKESRNLADDEIIWLEPKTGAKGEVIGGGEKGFKCKAAQDPGVLAGVSDASGEVLAPHGIGDYDKV
jgi:hypothetical protein